MRHFYNPKAIASLLGLLITGLNLAFLNLLEGVSTEAFMVVGITSFSFTLLLSYFVLEFLFFREILQIYRVVGRLKKKDFKKSRKRLIDSENPLRALRRDIFTLSKKQEKELSQQLKTMQRQEEEIDQLKMLQEFRRDFLADVSHELKTPIFSAQGFIHTLLDGAADDEEVRRRFLKKAASSMDGLENLVNDLLTLTKLETGSIKMHPDSFNLEQLILEVFEQLEIKAQDKQIDLSLDNQFVEAPFIYADQQRIRQVFTNLVMNAIKYGNPGGWIRIQLQKAQRFVEIKIQDNGPGIAAEHINRIFERLYRVEKSRSKDKGGSGLGLAIVKQILQAHQSTIEVKSRVGAGTTFWFHLPLTHASSDIKLKEQIVLEEDQLPKT